jgi:hypothetical protein
MKWDAPILLKLIVLARGPFWTFYTRLMAPK